VTIIRLASRIAKLEQRRNPPEPDPRIAAEAREITLHRILALAAVIEPGPLEDDFDVAAVLTALARDRQ
jgi:hypothetical protein